MKVEKGLIQLLKPEKTGTTNQNNSIIYMINVIGAIIETNIEVVQAWI